MRRLLILITAFAVIALGLAVPALAKDNNISFTSVGEKYAGSTFKIKGYLSGTGAKNNKTIQLQRKWSGTWHNVKKKTKQDDGVFYIATSVPNAGTAKLRGLVYKRVTKVIDMTSVLKIKIIPAPGGGGGTPTPTPTPTVTAVQGYLNILASSDGNVAWQVAISGPTTWRLRIDVTKDGAPANSNDGLKTGTTNDGGVYPTGLEIPGTYHVVGTLTTADGSTLYDTSTSDFAIASPASGNPRLPNLRIRNLGSCPDSERALSTNQQCFRIEPATATDSGGALLHPGVRLLKFPVDTLNVGAGAMEVDATRTSSSATTWTAVQRIFTDNGIDALRPISGMQFTFAGDGHRHWHIVDFDTYNLETSTNEVVVGEKHGYCLQDNINFTTIPHVAVGVYTEESSCGANNASATSIVHGLSVGWGDRYPSTLPDQAINITGLSDGDYTVHVTADGNNYLDETDDSDNGASAVIHFAGDVVTLVSTTGGVTP